MGKSYISNNQLYRKENRHVALMKAEVSSYGNTIAGIISNIGYEYKY
jgi:hypothetical protein